MFQMTNNIFMTCEFIRKDHGFHNIACHLEEIRLEISSKPGPGMNIIRRCGRSQENEK